MLLNVNGSPHTLDDPWTEETLLDVLRERLGLVGAKYGCGVGLCGACTVLVDDVPQRACPLPVRSVGTARVTTVEGLSDRGALHPVQRAGLEESVPDSASLATTDSEKRSIVPPFGPPRRRRSVPGDSPVDPVMVDRVGPWHSPAEVAGSTGPDTACPSFSRIPM